VQRPDYEVIAKSIIDSNVYMTLGTADSKGNPWTSPVFFATNAYKEFIWVSYPDARHSTNIAQRSEVSIVIFDSHVPVGAGQAVYMDGHAGQIPEEEHADALTVYPGPSERGARPFTIAEVRRPSGLRLYRAVISKHWILDPGSDPMRRDARDYRVEVEL
jgi:hypothetical protein